MEHVLHGDVDDPTGVGTFGVSDRFKSIVKHRRLGKRGSCMQKTGWTDLNDLYVV